jgi:hypothetical protein
MLHFLWLTRLRDQWFGKGARPSRKRSRPATRQRLYRRLHLEALEDRLVPSGFAPPPELGPSVPGLTPSSPPSSPSPPPALPSSPAPPGSPPSLNGTWTQLTSAPVQGMGTMLLLPNGGVMVEGPGVANTWYELQPDATGSYLNGAWTQLASMHETRLYFGSSVLPNDQVFVIGGEYPSFDNTAELYNMATNTWTYTAPAPTPDQSFGDDPTATLPGGQILAGYYGGPQTYLFNPSTNTWTTGPTKLAGDASDEETWVKLPASTALPQGGILSWSIFASIGSGTFMGEVYNIATGAWTATLNATGSSAPQLLSSSAVGYELGGAEMLPNGKVFQLGANGNTAIYDPSTNTWSAGPQIKDKAGNLLGADDAPASILPDGQVVFTADFGPTSGTFSPPTELFDYDYNTNTITQVTAGLPANLSSDLKGSPSYIDRTIVLPSGQLLLNDGNNMFLFTPSDSPQNAWRPSISSIVKTVGNTYTVTGLQLSGLSEGSSYGDDVNVSENYPIITLTAGSKVYYETSKNWSNVLVSPVGDATLETVQFTLPNNFPNGTYQVSVIANGISSNPFTFTTGLTKVTTTAQPVSSETFSPNDQTVKLTADVNVVSGVQTVNLGTVTFKVTDSKGDPIGTPVLGAVTGGVASANFTLPGNSPVGTYTVSVSYSDGTNTFIDNGDTGTQFTVGAASASAKAIAVSTNYSPNNQSLLLTANVSDDSIVGDLVNEGTVQFKVEDSGGNTIGTGPVVGPVINGVAHASFTVPAGKPPAGYTIFVSYNDPSGNFTDYVPGDASAPLAITPASAVTTAQSFSVTYNRLGQSNVQLTANVVDASVGTDTVGEGTVQFKVDEGGGKTLTTQGSVNSSGKASANLNLPVGLAAGNYTIHVLYSDSSGNFTDGGDTSGTMTVLPDLVAATAGSANLVFSTAAQPLALSATVTNDIFSTDIVNEGTVTFTILNSSNKAVGNAFGNVTSGTANATFTWAAGQPAGSYTIAVSYADNQGNYADDSLDFSSTLAVAAANVTTTVTTSPTLIVSSNPQTIALNATLADTSHPSDIVNEGTVTFKIQDKGGNTVGTAQAAVSGGAAGTSFSVKGGQAVGLYTIVASYSDSLKNFSDNGSGDTPGQLTIAPANVITTANNASAIYSPNGETVKLVASVANTSVPSNTVGEGTVTFTIVDSGNNTVGTAQGNVSGGTVNASFTPTTPLAAGTYNILVGYKDSTGNDNFTDAGDKGATLTITPANATVKASNVTTAYSSNTQSLALSASVTDTSFPADKVNEGAVTFTITGGGQTIGSITANVTNGTATANNFTVPAGQALGNYTIGVSYQDSTNAYGNVNVLDSGDTGGALTITPANVTTATGNVLLVYSPNSQSLAVSATVANASIATDPVNEGAVTFTISNGSTLVGSAQGTVKPNTGGTGGGTASANFNLPAGLAAGSYTIGVSYGDSTGHFLDTSNTGGTLTVSAANVTTKANSLTAAYSPNARVLNLGASVSDTSIPTDTVSQGVVTFTVMNGNTTIGTTTGLVSGGTASAGFNLSAGQALGNYTIGVSYSDSANNNNFTDAGDTAGTLAITAANVTTKANNVPTVYNLNSQTVLLGATVTDTSVPGDVVTGGFVTFTVMNGSSSLGSVQGAVRGGAASANFNLPAGQNAGNYSIVVSYSSTGTFVDSGDTAGTLTVQPASVTTTASSTSTTYSGGPQSLALSANVTDPGPAINTVNEGFVLFTIKSGSTVVASVLGTVNNDTASANVNLPAGLAAGNYTIAVTFSDIGGNFADNGDTGGTLTVGTANTTTQITTASIAPNYSNLTVTEYLAAHVSSGSPVTSGTITFSLSGQTITANVDGSGNASATLTLPMLTLIGPQNISINYADSAHNLNSSSSAQTASWQLSNPLIPTTTKFTDKGEVVTIDLFGLLITFTNGVLTEMDFNGIDVVFVYSASNQLIGMTVDGTSLVS